MLERVYAGIDPSITNTGVVLLGEDGELVAAINGSVAYAKKKFSYNIERYLVQASYIAGELAKYRIAASAYEDYSMNSIHRVYDLAEYGGVLKRELLMIGVKPWLVPPTVNKKFATGHGDAGKEMVAKQAINECPALLNLGKRKLTNDITDAFFLAKYALYRSSPSVAATIDLGNKALRTRLEIVQEAKHGHQ